MFLGFLIRIFSLTETIWLNGMYFLQTDCLSVSQFVPCYAYLSLFCHCFKHRRLFFVFLSKCADILNWQVLKEPELNPGPDTLLAATLATTPTLHQNAVLPPQIRLKFGFFSRDTHRQIFRTKMILLRMPT